jgi:hypothetical protein
VMRRVGLLVGREVALRFTQGDRRRRGASVHGALSGDAGIGDMGCLTPSVGTVR